MTRIRYRSVSRGVALPLVLIFLTMLVALSASTLQSGIIEYRIAGNDRFREEAFQLAQAVMAGITQELARFPLGVEPGLVACSDALRNTACAALSAELLGNYRSDIPHDRAISYEIERLNPLLQQGFLVRERQNLASSSLAYDAALFEVRVWVDSASGGLGTAGIAQGIAILTPSATGARGD